jgi:hypothetical protein
MNVAASDRLGRSPNVCLMRSLRFRANVIFHQDPGKFPCPSDPWTKIETPDNRPERTYDDVLVSIMAEKGWANGLPSGHARWLNALDLEPGDHVLHCGCGTGYYTAIIAHLVGDDGLVTAI